MVKLKFEFAVTVETGRANAHGTHLGDRNNGASGPLAVSGSFFEGRGISPLIFFLFF